ncbi:MAG: BrnA antitoxin family protein [Rhodobacteraceae bacterium]|nr:BrnA antitoxin family protein [Paracoccaceae bacterium]
MNEKNITKITLSEARKLKGETDWDRVAKSDGYEDVGSEDDFDWSNAVIVEPPHKKMVSIRLDAEVLEFFKASGKGYQTRINAVLKSFVTAHRTD